MKIAELKPKQKKITVRFNVGELEEEREVGLSDGTKHRVCEFLVGDETGSILLSIWDKAIDVVENGKVYELENGYTTIFKHSLRLNKGKFGVIKEICEEIGKVNKSNNLSEKELSKD